MSDVVVTLTNRADVDVFVSGDPNWDDQELKVDGQVIRGPYTLAKGGPVTLSVSWNAPAEEEMMGVIFGQTKSSNDNFYQLAIGQNPGTGDLAVTRVEPFGSLAFRFTTSDLRPWSMSIVFENA
jgi:hypothetical protein